MSEARTPETLKLPTFGRLIWPLRSTVARMSTSMEPQAG
jgi:hypothetical protein